MNKKKKKVDTDEYFESILLGILYFLFGMMVIYFIICMGYSIVSLLR